MWSSGIRGRLVVALAAGGVVLAGCGLLGGGDDFDPESIPHSHGADGEHVSLPVGDGTRAEEVGYTLADSFLPERAGEQGEMGFRIDAWTGDPQTEFLVEQTKEMHTYVVRDDLAVFRHIHPQRDDEGNWTTRLTLPEPGRYRVIAEFIARDEGGNGDHIILGDTIEVAGEPTAAAASTEPTGSDGTVRIAVEGEARLGNDQRITTVITDAHGRPLELGTYLGTYAHLTGFHDESGSLVHMHPMGAPEVSDDGTRLEFHTTFTEPGDYTLFVQVRVGGFLHTVPVRTTVS